MQGKYSVLYLTNPIITLIDRRLAILSLTIDFSTKATEVTKNFGITHNNT